MAVSGAVCVKSTHVAEIDYLRGIAILGIVTLHSLTSIAYDDYSQLTSSVLFITIFVGFAVPFFFVISGYVIYYNYKGKIDLASFYKKRLWTVVPAYVLFSIIYYIYNNVSYSLIGFLQDIATFQASGHLWFVAAIIAFYILYPFILWFFNRMMKGSFLLLIVTAGLFQIAYYLAIRDILPDSIAGASSFMGYVLYFAVGMYLGSKPKSLKVDISRILVSCSMATIIAVSLFLTWAFYQSTSYEEWGAIRELVNPLLVMAALFLFLFISTRIKDSERAVPRALKEFGKCSYGIYLVHILFITLIINVLTTYVFSYNDALLYVVLVPSAMAISYITIDLMSRVSLLNRVFSLKR